MSSSNNRIKFLPQSLINKIAAGEVVERPASVVKELMENALDADATEITVEIEQGGKRLIAVRDNGCGMSKEDLALSIHPHTTSKITSIEDLFNIATFGFRGEALSSIASVSELRIVSKEKGAGVGYELAAGENGKGGVQPVGATVGTAVTCKNLFYNIPARQKFLKSDATEFAHILETFLQYALINYEIAFTLVHNKRTVHQLAFARNWDGRIGEVLGKIFLETALPARFETRDFRVNGFVVSPREAREKSKQQYVFINKRPVRDYLIVKAVRSGYGNLIMGRENPSFILDVWINPARVDVNVHPRKLEVKHENPGEIFGFIERALRRALLSAPNVLKGEETSILDENVIARGFTPALAPRRSFAPAHTPYKTQPSFATSRVGETFTGAAGHIHDAPRLLYDTSASKITALGRIIGQLHNSYILMETTRGLMLIDQHAASERINYERLIAQLNAHKQIEKQALLVPLTVEVSLNERQALETSSGILGSLGFDIVSFGGNTFVLNTTPAELKVHNPQELLKDILTDLLEETRSALSLEDKKKKMIAVVSCRSAIKFGDSLTEGEQRALLETLERTPNNVSCIHGRPVFYTVELEELAKWFKRR